MISVIHDYSLNQKCKGGFISNQNFWDKLN